MAHADERLAALLELIEWSLNHGRSHLETIEEFEDGMAALVDAYIAESDSIEPREGTT